MQMPSPLSRVPKVAFVAVVPIAAFVVFLGVSLGSGGGEQKSSDVASAAPTTSASSTPASSPTPEVSPTALANRANCQAIQGSAYQSDDERNWFVQNCMGGSGGSGGAPAAAGRAEAASGAEFALGDTLIIPAAGVNTPVYGSTVGGNGVMGTPVGYFYALWYDFRAFPGLGGYVDKGNLVLAGHVDCARCQNGGPGAAVFYNVRNLKAGDTIQYRTANGQVQNYVVTSAEWHLPESNWSGLLASNAADLTIVTCIGTFDTSRREYSNRLVIYARKS